MAVCITVVKVDGCPFITTNVTCYQTCYKWQFCLSAGQCTSTSIQLLQCETPDYFFRAMATQQPDLNPVNYKIWGVIQQCVYETRINSDDELKQQLVDVWSGLQQSIVDTAISEWRVSAGVCSHKGMTFWTSDIGSFDNWKRLSIDILRTVLLKTVNRHFKDSVIRTF